MTTTASPGKKNQYFLGAFFGGLATIHAATWTHPLETVKTRIQMQGVKKAGSKSVQYGNMFRGLYIIHTNEGFKGLYKGIEACWLRESIYAPLRLGLYEPIKQLYGADIPNPPFYKKVAASATSGFIASIVSNPIDMLKIRMQASETTSNPLSWHVKDIKSKKGYIGFFEGLKATITRAMVLNVVNLSIYDTVKQKLTEQ